MALRLRPSYLARDTAVPGTSCQYRSGVSSASSLTVNWATGLGLNRESAIAGDRFSGQTSWQM